MVFIEALQKVYKHISIIFYPICFDLIALAAGWYLLGFYGESYVSIALILEMGLPSISHLSNIPLMLNDVGILTINGEIPSYTWVLVVAILVAGAFVQGGYIRFLYAITKGIPFSFAQFLREGRKSWLQFILLHLIIYLLKIGVTGFLVIFFGIIGVFASLAILFALRIVYIYLEFCISVDRLSVAEALKKSRWYFANSRKKTTFSILLMYAFSGLLSLFLHAYWMPVVLVVLLFSYAFGMTVIQTIFMGIFCQTRERLNGSSPRV